MVKILKVITQSRFQKSLIAEEEKNIGRGIFINIKHALGVNWRSILEKLTMV